MTETQNIAEIIQLGIALLSVWILFFKLFRTYRTDALRDRLFAVRQELFDYADGGGVGFDEPAYTKLRGLLNSLIRFAHHLTFTRFLLGLVWACWGDSDFKKQPIERWRLAMSKLPPESSGRLDEIHTGAVVLVVRHLTTGSPLMLSVLALFTLWSVIHGVTRFSLRLLAERLPGLDSLQEQAVMADSMDRKSPRETALAHH